VGCLARVAETMDMDQSEVSRLEADFAERIASLVVPGAPLTATS
jgi:hypothetical protein